MCTIASFGPPHAVRALRPRVRLYDTMRQLQRINRQQLNTQIGHIVPRTDTARAIALVLRVAIQE